MLKKLLVDLYKFSSSSQRNVFYRLQFLIISMAVLEVITIAFLGLFIKLLSDLNFIYTNNFVNLIFIWSNVSETKFLIYLGISMVLLLFLSSSLSIFTIWKSSLFASRWGTELGNRLYKNYINQSWLYHADSNSSLLTKKISVEVFRVTDKVITQVLLMNARVVLVIIITISLLIFNPVITGLGFVIFAISYISLYKLVSKSLYRNSVIITEENSKRFKTLSEGLNGMLDVIILNKRKEFYEKFRARGVPYYRAHGTNVALTMIPKFFMEFLIFGGFTFAVVILLIQGNFELNKFLPIIAIYGLVGIKFLPAFQQIYNGITQIKGNIDAWEDVKKDIRSDEEFVNFNKPEDKTPILLNKKLQAKNLFFQYKKDSKKMINGVNFDLKVNSKIGILGTSGSGKSTLINLITGLTFPTNGEIKIDDVKINSKNVVSWQKNIGYVSQDVYLTDESISENIAFGVSKSEINIEQINFVLEQSNLKSFVDQLPNGIDTLVGEKGVQISGGQRQRIAIARALYNNPQVIIFDEATSSLDGINEKNVMDTIDKINAKLIIIVAHRLNTIKNCDKVLFIDNGEIVDQGSFDSVYKRQKTVREMQGDKNIDDSN
jgi:ATP-binding cassette, subfamily B, bacterial PglK